MVVSLRRLSQHFLKGETNQSLDLLAFDQPVTLGGPNEKPKLTTACF